jgi:ribonuclease HII
VCYFNNEKSLNVEKKEKIYCHYIDYFSKNMLQLYQQEGVEAGIDEAGRGCLFGPVFAAAVVWNPEINEGLAQEIKDSKKVTPKKREILADYIEKNALAYGVASVSAEQIDNVNILNATYMAMHSALDIVCVKMVPEHVIVDGNLFKIYMTPSGDTIPFTCVTDGDNKYLSIAAASILAKVHRDRWIKTILISNPDLSKYDLGNNMGYGTKKHMNAIKVYGISSLHRKSFGPCR